MQSLGRNTSVPMLGALPLGKNTIVETTSSDTSNAARGLPERTHLELTISTMLVASATRGSIITAVVDKGSSSQSFAADQVLKPQQRFHHSIINSPSAHDPIPCSPFSAPSRKQRISFKDGVGERRYERASSAKPEGGSVRAQAPFPFWPAREIGRRPEHMQRH
jgi:hypothetical protein